MSSAEVRLDRERCRSMMLCSKSAGTLPKAPRSTCKDQPSNHEILVNDKKSATTALIGSLHQSQCTEEEDFTSCKVSPDVLPAPLQIQFCLVAGS